MTEGRVWRMWAGLDPAGTWRNAGDRRYVTSYGRTPLPVHVAEDPDGPHWGWIGAGTDHPVMIQPHAMLFRMQFPYGPQAEADRGKGRVVRLTISAADEDFADDAYLSSP